MKKYKDYIGILGGILLLVAVFFKSLHYPGANILIQIGATFGVLYFVISLFHRDSIDPSPCAKFAEYIVPITMLAFLVSFIFKVSNWPGGSILVTISAWMLTITSLTLMFSILMNKDKQFITISKVVFALIYIIPVLVFVSKPF